ncbi:MAG: hypothetical protein ACREDR_25105 [Blastocatellia bacterium]
MKTKIVVVSCLGLVLIVGLVWGCARPATFKNPEPFSGAGLTRLAGHNAAQASPAVPTGWKTYSNSEYRFAVSYPPEWTFEDANDSNATTMGPATFLFGLSRYGPTRTSDLSFDDGAILDFGITPSLTQEVKGYIAYPRKYNNAQLFSAYGFLGSYKLSSSDDDQELVSAYRVLPGGYVLVFNWQRVGVEHNDFSYQKMLLPILSTFTLTR